ncbi:nucleotidyltransferase [Vibrio agarivorans]|nr:nucleotidyltransferase [Vibrio agarivorans]
MPLCIIDSQQPFQPEFEPLINETLRYLKSGLNSNLHSVYVYGSVARKTAIVGKSNLDLIVVTTSGFENNRASLLNTIKWRAQQRYSHVKGVSIRTTTVKEVINLDSLFTWGFLIKHCTHCVYGDNLGECFGDYVPSWEIAKHWNMDVAEWLTVYRSKIAQAQSIDALAFAQTIIAKKLLRASYSLVMYRDKRWFDDPIECGEIFLTYHPEKQVEIERLGILLSGRHVPKRSVIGLIDSFGAWLVKQYKKTEFRIG